MLPEDRRMRQIIAEEETTDNNSFSQGLYYM